MAASRAVNVFEYLDYRAALRALYEHKKAHEYGFSHRAFSRRAGLKSTNFLKLVMDGERNLSPAVAQRFARAFGMSASESEYFCELVGYAQATTSRDRAVCHERLSKLKPQRRARELDASQAAYHSRWYIPAIRELAASPSFRADPAWIARTLAPSITTQQAKKALSVLLSLDLLRVDGAGVPRPVDAQLTTGPQPLGHHIADFHRAMLDHAKDAIDVFPREERELGALTLCIDESMLPVLKARLQTFRRELMELAEADGTGPRERVVQVSFQLFPLSKRSS